MRFRLAELEYWSVKSKLMDQNLQIKIFSEVQGDHEEHGAFGWDCTR